MSGKEAPRPGILKALCDARITNRQAADALHLSVRQVQRLKLRYGATGAPGLVHRGRGRPSARRLDEPVRDEIARLITSTYARFNDVHLTEKLCEVEKLSVSRPTVRRLRRALGVPATRTRRGPAHRARRARHAAAGSLVQIDGSPFAWLEGRGPVLTLLGVRSHGLPMAFYGDRLNVFVRNDRHWTLAEELQGAQDPTHLGRVCS